MYRHTHNDLKAFLDSLNDKLINLNSAKKTYFLLGDMNIDISSNVQTTSKDNYFKMIESNGALSIITKPTRITVTSQTTLDHFSTNGHNHRITTGIIETEKNDHLPIFCMIDTNRVTNGTEKSYIQDLGDFKHNSYCNELKKSLQNFLFYLPHINNHSNNYDHAFQEFVFTVKSIIDKHAPLKLTTRKQHRLNKKPCITKGLLISIRKKQNYIKHIF